LSKRPHVVPERPRRDDGEDREARFHDDDRPVLEVCRGEGLAEYATHLLKLQSPLEGGTEVESAGEHGGPIDVSKRSGHRFDRRTLIEHLLGEIWHAGERGVHLRVVRQRRGEHRHGEELSGVRLGRGDGVLGSGPQSEHVVALGRERRAGIVGDGKGRPALPASLCQDRDHVGRLARLGDRHRQRSIQ
jgi:hypothetical protein